MAETQVKSLFDKLKDTEKKFDRTTILSLLYSRIASGLENSEAQPREVGVSDPSEIWSKSTAELEKLNKLDPNKCFLIGVDLILLSESADPNKEKINKWIRTNGLIVLAFEGNEVRLADYFLKGEKSFDLVSVLKHILSQDISDLKEIKDLSDPRGFSTVQGVYVGLGLGRTSEAVSEEIFNMARKRRTDEDFVRIARIIKTFADCAYLSKRL